jgi:prepilin-type N-terminal cleavage/methylation domain-containing protein
MAAQDTSRSGGFTLVEVLIVVIIVGLAGAVVVPHMLRAGTMTTQAAARTVIADLLYAQNEAIAQQAPRRIAFDVDTNSYRITDANDLTLETTWRVGGGGAHRVDFDEDGRFQGVRLESVDFAGSSAVQFDDLGAPDNGGSIVIVSNQARYRITVAPFTGRVTVAEDPPAGG